MDAATSDFSVMMDFNPIPSLKHMALVTAATSMWTKPDIKDLAEQNDIPSDTGLSNPLDKIVTKVKERVDKIPLPELLKKDLSRLIKPIGHEIWRWLRCEHGYSSLDMKNTEEFYWTNQGTIDTKKTAQRLIKNEKVDLDTRYKIAAIHCLEDDYHSLRKKYENIHEVCDVSFALLVESCLKDEYAQQNFFTIDNRHMSRFKRHFKIHNERMFQYAARTGNEAATRHFLQKLTPEEKKKNVMIMYMLAVEKTRHPSEIHSLPNDSFPNDCPCLLEHKSRLPAILFLLLSVMSKEQRTEAIILQFRLLLGCFLDHPWQYLFFELLEHCSILFRKYSFLFVMMRILQKIKQRYDDYDYENLLSIFWVKCPTVIKKKWLGKDHMSFPAMLLSCGNKNGELYLNDLVVACGKEVIFQNEGKVICKYLIEENLWDLYKLFIQKCISSQDLMVKFKEEFSDFIIMSPSRWTKDVKEMSLNMIDDCVRSFNKRGAVEDHQPAKRLCFMRAEGIN